MSLRQLYQEMILDHGKTPRNHGKLTAPTHSHAGHNPLCGDKLMLYIREQDGRVAELCFEGTGCAISMASASLMTESIKGKTRDEITTLFDHFHHLVTTGESNSDALGKLAVFSGVAEYPVRVKCATLAWHTLRAALDNDPQPVTTE